MKTIKKLLAKLSRVVFHNYSYCRRCGFTWNIVNPRTVHTSNGFGCFATCDKCWDEANVNELIFYHTRVYKNWHERDYTLDHLLKCVKAEKENNPIFMRVET